MCSLQQHGNVGRYLREVGVETDRFDDIRTLDDENMLVVFDGRVLRAVRFTTFGPHLSEEKCSLID